MKSDFEEIYESYLSYIEYERRLSEKSVESYSREIREFISYLSSLGLSEIPVESIYLENYIKKRSDDGISERTVERVLSSLRSFYSFLIIEDIVTKNPAKELDRPKSHMRLPKTLSEKSVERLLDAFGDDELSLRDWALFELIYSSGMRISEALSLDVSSIDLESGSIRVIGKRDKERSVFIGSVSREALRLYLIEVRPKLVKRKREKEKALFLNKNGTRLTRQGAYLKYKKIVENLGLDATIHTLRHSFASHMISRGADIRSLQEMLGHSDIKTTQIYTHLDNSKMLSLFDEFSPLS